MDAPMSSSLGAMGPLLRKLELLLAPEYPLRKSVKQAIKLLKEDLEDLYDTLMEKSMVDSPNNKATYWMDEVRELSYDIEDAVDDMTRPRTSADAKVRSIHNHRIPRLKIARLSQMLKQPTRISRITELRTLLLEASERHERFLLDGCASNPGFAFTGRSRRVPPVYKVSADLVGMEGSRSKLTKWLTNLEERQLQVLSIVGPPGVGKSTLVRELYREVKGQFECRAFIRMSRKPDVSRVLREILSQVQDRKGTCDSSTVQNSIGNIRGHLQDKRYFIVIDDLWEAAAWDIINNAFPKGNNCSRIIIVAETQDEVAKCCDYPSISVYEVESPSIQDSERLLLSRVFGSEHHCPDHLKQASSSIIRKCGNLPLATITIAGLLASEPDNSDLWHHLQQYFLSNLANLTLSDMLKELLNLCYNRLPQYLKTCLLYLNMYPEGCTIRKIDLLKQWIAEGFINSAEGVEGVAQSYFDELVNRGMIHPEKINHNDEVLSCTVHHIVHDLITQKSSEQNFVTAVDYSQTITGFSMKPRRLFLQFSCAQYATKPEGIRLSQVRALAFFGLHRCIPSIMEFKLLRVLILELWGAHDGCTSLNLSGICRLFLLRYLKVKSHIFVELPSQIQGLQFLETLEIDARVSAVPVDIAYLPCLLHLSLTDETKLPDMIGRITSLKTLEYFDLGNNSEASVRSLGELINLQALHLTCSMAVSNEHLKRNLVALSSSLGRLASLKSLILAPGIAGITIFVDQSYGVLSTPIFIQRLELLSPICIFSIIPTWIVKLQNLRILNIIVRVLSSNNVDVLAGLPDLTALSLFVRRPTVQSVVFHSGAFPVLKYFNYRCGALCLAFENEAFPSLEMLKLGFNAHRGDQYCHMIDGIENLGNLKKVTVQIGAAAGAEELDRRAAESAFKHAIRKHSGLCFLNVKRVDWVEEEEMLVDKQGARRMTPHVGVRRQSKKPEVTDKVMVTVPTRMFQSLLRMLTELLSDDNLLHEIRIEIELLHHELICIEALLQTLGDMEKFRPGINALLRTKLRLMAYEIEYGIDLFINRLVSADDKDGLMRHVSKQLCYKVHHHANRIQEIRAQVTKSIVSNMWQELYDFTYISVDDRYIPDPRTHKVALRLSPFYVDTNHELVAMAGSVKNIVELLTREDDSAQQLQIVSILGVAGIGKTKVACQVYSKIKDQFDFTAFVYVSESVNLPDILRNLAPDAISGGSSDLWQNIAAVKEYLRRKKFLIVFDGIWSIETWDCIRSVLPQNNKKSKVITTTRITDVAHSCCSKSGDFIYVMDPLNPKKLYIRRTILQCLNGIQHGYANYIATFKTNTGLLIQKIEWKSARNIIGNAVTKPEMVKFSQRNYYQTGTLVDDVLYGDGLQKEWILEEEPAELNKA